MDGKAGTVEAGDLAPGTACAIWQTAKMKTAASSANKLSWLLGATALLAFLSLAPAARGLPVAGLYEQRVAVENESLAERNRAYQVAFRRMILKVTGDERWLETGRVRGASGNAGDYVQAFAYATEEAAGPIAGQRYIEVQFSAPLINQLLAAEDIPVWGGNRPSVLVWMALQDASGQRSLLNSQTGAEIIDYMRRFGEERGLPIIFPLLDLQDRRELSVDAVWAQDELAIRTASNRYGPDSILAGRLLFTATGELVGLWQFQFMDDTQTFDGFDSELESYLEQPLSRITSQLAGHFALVPGGQSERSVRLRVDGISDFSDYSALVEYVRGIGLVQAVDIVSVDGERLELLLDLQGNSDQLYDLIALDRDLLPINSGESAESPLLHYRWMR